MPTWTSRARASWTPSLSDASARCRRQVQKNGRDPLSACAGPAVKEEREAGPSVFVTSRLAELEEHRTSPCVGLREGDGRRRRAARPGRLLRVTRGRSPPCSAPAVAEGGSPRPTLTSEVHAPALVTDSGLRSARSPGRPRSPQPTRVPQRLPTHLPSCRYVAGARNVRRWVPRGPDAWMRPGVSTARPLAVMVPTPTDVTQEPASCQDRC